MTERRWSNEETALAELERLTDQSVNLVWKFRQSAVTAAEAEAAHKSARAKRVLLARANGVKSISEADTVAEADDEVGALHLNRLITAALAEADREAIRSTRTNIEAMRTAVASHRVQGQGL